MTVDLCGGLGIVRGACHRGVGQETTALPGRGRKRLDQAYEDYLLCMWAVKVDCPWECDHPEQTCSAATSGILLRTV